MLTPDDSTYRILAVDDEPHILQILKFTLEKAGYQVATAVNGEDALERIPETARSDLGERVKGLEGGANDYLVKPYSNEELLLRVKNVLEWNIKQKEANPLTGLPGNTAIERQLKNRISNKKPFSFLYIDIDNFKGFNDYYGYQKGDEIIGFLAGILTKTIEKLGTKEDFIGHIGGDDFVMVTPTGRAEIMAQYIIEEFDQRSLLVLKEDDVERGYLEVTNRQGEKHRVPLMSITIALVVSCEDRIRHFAEINDIAKEVKKYGKKIKGSVVVKERRQDEVSPANKIEGV
jgi:diguanylate cyclase (GGDEF)-like protein